MTARAITVPTRSAPSSPGIPASTPPTEPRSSTRASTATQRARIRTWLASNAARSTRLTSAPIASPPAFTIRLRLCPASRWSAVCSSRAPRPARRAISPGACNASAATAARSLRPAPASIVSLSCRPGSSPGPIAAARPPWAKGVAPPPMSSSLVSSSTSRPCRAAVRAAVTPAAPDPTTTMSASRSQCVCDHGRWRISGPLTAWPARRAGRGGPRRGGRSLPLRPHAGSAVGRPVSSSSCTGTRRPG